MIVGVTMKANVAGFILRLLAKAAGSCTCLLRELWASAEWAVPGLTTVTVAVTLCNEDVSEKAVEATPRSAATAVVSTLVAPREVLDAASNVRAMV